MLVQSEKLWKLLTLHISYVQVKETILDMGREKYEILEKWYKAPTSSLKK